MRIARIIHGSKLYGLNTEKSDTDYYDIYIPKFKDVIFSTLDNKQKKSDDEDIKKVSLFEFAVHLKNGEMRSVEALFAPDEFIVETSPYWEELRKNRYKLLNSNLGDALGYCNTHARYHVFDNRHKKELEHIVEVLSGLDPETRVQDHISLLEKSFKTTVKKNGNTYLEVANRKAGFTNKVGQTLKQYKESLNNIAKHEWRKRLDTAGFDWKGLSHVCRVMRQVELILTQRDLQIPVREPERTFFLDVKLGRIPYEDVAAYIDKTYSKILTLTDVSFNTDETWLDEFVLETYWNTWKKESLFV